MLFGNGQLVMTESQCCACQPSISGSKWRRESGFAAYGPRITEIPEITARQAVMLFSGTKVADIPVEQPTKFELVINLKTDNALGVTVPPALLARADKVVE